MGKVNFQSHKVDLLIPAEKVYSFILDLNNFQKMMPEQVVNWQSTSDSCAFDIKGMAHITLQRTEAIPEKFIRIVSGPETPIELELRAYLEKQNPEQTAAWIELTADLSPILKLMVSGPLQNLVNIMAEKLKAAQI